MPFKSNHQQIRNSEYFAQLAKKFPNQDSRGRNSGNVYLTSPQGQLGLYGSNQVSYNSSLPLHGTLGENTSVSSQNRLAINRSPAGSFKNELSTGTHRAPAMRAGFSSVQQSLTTQGHSR